MFAISPLQPGAERMDSAPSVPAPRSGTDRPSIHAPSVGTRAPHSSPGSGFPLPNHGVDVRAGGWGVQSWPRSSGPSGAAADPGRAGEEGGAGGDAPPPARKTSSSLGGATPLHAADRRPSRASESSGSSPSLPHALGPSHAHANSSSSESSRSEARYNAPASPQGMARPAPPAL